MDKIVVTGATGFIAGIIRRLYADHQVILLSRSALKTNDNETLIQCNDLTDVEWWTSVILAGHFDRVFHLAEPVKQSLTAENVDRIVLAHIAFLESMTKQSSQIYYPLTAYRYDDGLASASAAYCNIKERVYNAKRTSDEICFPVIHPIIDAGQGLQALRKIESKIPCLNIFSNFSATMPILYRKKLEQFLVARESFRSGMIDLYSEQISISKIFYQQNRIDIPIVSRALSSSMRLGSKIWTNDSLSMLLKGRRLHDSNS